MRSREKIVCNLAVSFKYYLTNDYPHASIKRITNFNDLLNNVNHVFAVGKLEITKISLENTMYQEQYRRRLASKWSLIQHRLSFDKISFC